MFLLAGLVCSCWIDLQLMILPDFFTLGALLLLPAAVYFNPDLTWASALWGYAAGGAIPVFLGWIFKKLRKKDGIGLGDIKLLALCGAFTGLPAVPCLLFLSAVFGILAITLIWLIQRRTFNPDQYILPFGPCISLAFFIMLLFPNAWECYYRLLL